MGSRPEPRSPRRRASHRGQRERRSAAVPAQRPRPRTSQTPQCARTTSLMPVKNLSHKRLIVRTVIAFEQVIADAFFSVNLMQASSLRTDGILLATTKTPKVQNEEFRIFKVAGEITLRRQVGSAHSHEAASDFCRQSMNILGIPYLILKGGGTGKRRRYLPEEAEQNAQCNKTGKCTHRHDQFPSFVFSFGADRRSTTDTTLR
jgi:hypothetical protein